MLKLTRVYSGDDIPVSITKFPAGETFLSVKEYFLNGHSNHLRIRLDFTSNDDLWNLGLLVDALRRMHPNPDIDLLIPYFPYARQDRVCNAGESHSLAFTARFINSLRLASVTVFDPHSDVTGALVDNIYIVEALDMITALQYKLPTFALVAPDSGAMKKVQKIGLKLGLDVIRADKVRNTKTGSLSGCTVYAEHQGNKDLLVVDDICDGGGTFLLLAPHLRKLTTGRVMLYVSHGIFSKGLDHLAVDYDAIYTGNNLSGLTHPKLTVL